MDRRLSVHSNPYDTSLNNDDNLYRNRNLEQLYRDSGIDGNGERLTKRNGELTWYL